MNTDRQRRKELINQIKNYQKKEFENNLPMDRSYFTKLFDYLDEELNECNDTTLLTEKFLIENNIPNVKDILEWLSNKGGFCDCEILSNIEEQFE